MTPQIDVDDEVFDLLKENAEPFVDTPNLVLRRLLGLDSEDDLQPPDRAVPSDTTPQPKQKSRQPKRRVRRGSGGHSRAPRGSLLPETEYELPILRALAAQPGGRAAAREVLEQIGPELGDRLTELDLQPIKTGAMRWHNRAQFARLSLVKAGQLAPDSPRGMWEITEAGRERAQADQT